MNAMETMAINMVKEMLVRLLGPQMPQVIEQVQGALDKVNKFSDRLTNIENSQNNIEQRQILELQLLQEIDHKVTLQAAGGKSIAEVIAAHEGMFIDQGAFIDQPLDVLMLENGDFFDDRDDGSSSARDPSSINGLSIGSGSGSH